MEESPATNFLPWIVANVQKLYLLDFPIFLFENRVRKNEAKLKWRRLLWNADSATRGDKKLHKRGNSLMPSGGDNTKQTFRIWT